MTTPTSPSADRVFEYVTAHTGTVHLRVQGDPAVLGVTICGRRIDVDWPLGDESLSGVAATCRTCRAFAQGQAPKAAALDCTCDGTESPGSYRLGCPRHTQAALAAPPYVGKPFVASRPKTVYVGRCTVSRPVLGDDGNVWSQQEYVDCGHEHDDYDDATACAERLGRRLARSAR